MASLLEGQILERQLNDKELFESSCIKLAGAVMGKGFEQACMDNRRETKDAMDDMLKYFHLSPVAVPDSVNDSKDQIEWICRAHGIMYRRVRLTEGWQRNAIGPMIGVLRENGKPVALIPNKTHGYSFRDNDGKKRAVDEITSGFIEESAVCFYVPFPAVKLSLKDLGIYILRRISRTDIILLLVMMALATVAGLLLPRLTRILFAEVYLNESVRMLVGITLFMVCQILSQAVFKAMQNGFIAKIQQRLNMDVQAAATMRLLSLPARFFADYSAGDLHTRIGKLPRLCDTLINVVLTNGISSLFSIIYLTQIRVLAPALFVPSLIIIGITAVFTVVSSVWQIRITRKQMELEAKENAMSYAMITGIQKIRLAGAERRFFGRWAELYAKNAHALYNIPLFLRLNRTINLAINVFGTLYIYSTAVSSGLSVADFFAFNSAFGLVFGAFAGFSAVALEAAKIRPMMELAEPILNTVPEISDDKRIVERLSGSIELNNVHFRYSEDSPWIMDGISFRIRPNDYVAIVGKTGCGKSTLVRLLLGFEKPEKGAIYYDGNDMERLDPRSLRQKIGTVMQNDALFIGSILENILVSAPNLTENEAWEAAETAGIANYIRKLPMGMQTLISEGYGGISGGQKQRLLITRAIAPKPKILIFDEATSALDNETQRQVTEALDKLRCTRIVIAHRLSTIKSCKRILYLEKGKIVEDGNYDELMEKKGKFYELVKRQQA